jgi:hypothetical protein
MAPFLLLGGRDAVFLVVPLFGALLVWATYAVGARFSARAGLAAAALAACSPAFLYQLVQPMSDVPAAALWTTAVAIVTGTGRRGPVAAGLATSAAILVRPNLVPLGIPIGLFLLLRPERAWRDRLRAGATYAAWCAPGCVAVAVIQRMFYGSPVSSGYGTLEQIFSMANVLPNATRYLAWMTETHTPLWLLAVAALFLLPGALAMLLAALFVVNVALYLSYHVFDDWSYLRFLLPSIPAVMVLVAASVDALTRRVVRHGLAERAPAAAAVMAIVVLGVGVVLVREGRDRQAFRLERLEARYTRAGEFVDRRLPGHAIVITSWQSGSVRFYSGRRTLQWDGLDAAWLDRAIEYVRSRGLEPYLLFERWEEPIFRRRFGASAYGALDWPPMAEVATVVRIYRPGDRERYLRGQQPPTEYAR